MADLGITEQNLKRDSLFAGDLDQEVKPVTIVSGQNLVRGTILGKIKAGAVPTTGNGTGNTGNGTCASVTGGRKTIAGTYVATCFSATSNLAQFKVVSPSGKMLGIAQTGVAFTSDEINLTIADGSTDFIVGDKFDIVVPAGSGKYKAYAATNVDGSGVAECILVDDTDASSADQKAVAFYSGCFNENALTGLDATARADFEGTAIILKVAL